MNTEFFVEYQLFDVTALEDARETSDSNMDFADLSLMKHRTDIPNYGTLEHNFFILDGRCDEFPDTPNNLAYFSSGQAKEDGTFDVEQSIRIEFSENHASTGITLQFLEIYPLEIEVTWYNLEGNQLSKKTFYPDRLRYYCDNPVSQYGRIEIVFVKTLPYHNVKLQKVEYGIYLQWGNDSVKSAKLVSQSDVIGDKLKTDTLDFSFIDESGMFNASNYGGFFKTFERKQRMSPYEIVNGVYVPLGTFFMDNVSAENDICSINAIDFKGMLAYVDFRDGRVYNGIKAGDLIDEIMAVAKIEDYTVDSETANVLLYGTLKIQTCLQALREILFACGSSMNTSMRTDIEIKKNTTQSVRGTITKSQKFSTQLQTDKYVSDITVKYATWKLDEKESEITKGVYDVGTHIIQLSSPAENMSASAGQIIKQMPYYIILEVETKGEVVITGIKYVSEALAATASIEHIKAGEIRSAKTFSGTMLDYESAKQAAESILRYYQMQQVVQTKHIAGTERAGDLVKIENSKDGYSAIIGVVESMSINLTGGYINNAKFRGYLEDELNEVG